MLPIYDALDFIDCIPEVVGHTKPWVILAKKNKDVKKFVVKLYGVQQVESNYLCNEVICNILSREFGLNSPPAALINFPEYFQMNLTPELQIQLINSDPRLKFATELIENKVSYISGLKKSQILKRISIDTLYAFDNMIRNADRGQQKTNLLITPQTAFLIDHEFVLNKREISGINFNSFHIDDKFTRYHIFYNFLKNSRRKTKAEYFGEFSEYLRYANFNHLNPYFKQLNNEGISSYQTEILAWLNQVKQNSVTFEGLLKASLQ